MMLHLYSYIHHHSVLFNSILTAVCTIGTSEVEHVLATQTLVQAKAKNMRVHVEGALQSGVSSKDVVLHIIGVIGTAGGKCVILDAYLPNDFQLILFVLIEPSPFLSPICSLTLTLS